MVPLVKVCLDKNDTVFFGGMKVSVDSEEERSAPNKSSQMFMHWHYSVFVIHLHIFCLTFENSVVCSHFFQSMEGFLV